MKSILALVIGFGFTFQVQAAVVCKNGKAERSLEVVYQATDKKVPCSVKYSKDGQDSTLFQAASQEGFCEEKMKSMQDKLTGMGWNCGSGSEKNEL